MNEREWQESGYSYDMLDHIESESLISARKLRLFACGCCRLVWQHLPPESQAAVVVAEHYANAMVSWEALLAVIKQAPVGKKYGGSWVSYDSVQIKPDAQAQRTVLTLGGESPVESAWNAARWGNYFRIVSYDMKNPNFRYPYASNDLFFTQ